jgi:hypothetical protein
MNGRAIAVAAVIALMFACPAFASDEPVTISVDMPNVVASDLGFPVRVTVTSDPGALGSAPMRVRVRAATECGGTFDSTPGTVLLDAPLGPSGQAAGRASTSSFGSFTACAFLEQQGDNRLFAFDDSTTFAVTHPCTTAARRATATRTSLRKVRRALRHAHGAHRAALERKAGRLRAKLRRAAARQRRACS